MERNTYRGDGAVLSSRGLNPRSGVRSREVLDGSVHGEQPETEDGLCEKVKTRENRGSLESVRASSGLEGRRTYWLKRRERRRE